MKQTLFFLSFFPLFFLSQLHAQAPKGKLFVLNEGAFGGNGSVGVVDFATGTYNAFDNTLATFGNQITYINGKIYAVDGKGDIFIYDPNSLQKENEIKDLSARSIWGYKNQLLITSLERPYFRVFQNAAPYNLVYVIDSPDIASPREELVILNDKAYISNFMNDNQVAVVNLLSQSFVKNIQTNENPYLIKAYKGKAYAACYSYNPDFTTTTELFEIDPLTDTVTQSWLFEKASTPTAGDTAIYLLKSDGKLLAFDPQTAQIDSNLLQLGAYMMHYDPLSKALFYSQTDYVSYGRVGYTDSSALYPLISADIAPRSFCFLPTDSSSLSLSSAAKDLFVFYPNPVQQSMYVLTTARPFQQLLIRDVQGRTLLTQAIEQDFSEMDLSALPAGMYLLECLTPTQSSIKKFIKE